jgi:hypothetical protein
LGLVALLSKRRMILHGVFKGRLQAKKPLVHRGRIVAIEGDHFGAGLAAPDHLEGVRFNALDDGVGDGRGRFPGKAEFRPSAI